MRAASGLFSLLLLGMIRLYRLFLSPFMGRQCRFYPSCSVYGEEAIRRHGPVRGGWLTLCRICRCHPFHPGGVDYPP
ncbi:membrane protein insertion efficiency factor YidD [Parasaccharibacter apium]|uniref:Putative membrane protein insertion efficiency factor n=3 Tax=Parasaccharibacter TaxID=1602345 RepID=A0ABX4ZP71_9PROT|nr:membrane protein insertion efficiency factor YidD [Parasaccharibacter apium]POS64215.1 membrane protein insertion efficiency factor YidD [Parasaccharibacter apium]POS64556.1 membrane protein insertion efficiency factor YidD [Parasaccharibacter apium]